MPKLKTSAPLVPKLNDVDDELIQSWVPTDEEQKRGRRIHPRIDKMLEYRFPYEQLMRESMWLYHGKSRDSEGGGVDDAISFQSVSPYGYIFTEAKTAEEIQSTQDYKFVAVEDSDDAWKVDLLSEIKLHVDKKRNMGSLKHRIIRHKNIFGVSILRVGYRQRMRVIKERVLGDQDALSIEWEEREVPIEDDLFADIVNPFNFAIDPNAITLNDAEDCVHYHMENADTFKELYGGDPRTKNIDHVHTRLGGTVMVMEYFNKIRDEWCMYASGDQTGSIDAQDGIQGHGAFIEIMSVPLPDDHKELPFVSFHNNASFFTSFSGPVDVRSPTSGQDVSLFNEDAARPQESFWTQGDPITMKDLIDLNTGFHRAMFRAAKLAGQSIISTAGNFKFDTRKNWKSGDQAIGAMGKYDVTPLGVNNVSSYEFSMNDLFERMVQVSGVDPRNLAESSGKTATEAAIQRETALKRLEQGLAYNEENGWVRLGRLDLANFQQYYSIPELVRLTGNEDIGQFHDVVNDPKSGRPVVGKRFRRIQSDSKFTEERSKAGKFTLIKSDEGVNSFLSRPDYIRASQVDVAIGSGRAISQIRAVEIQQSREALELFAQLAPLTQPGTFGEQPLLSKEDLPNIKAITKKFLTAMGLSEEETGSSEPDVPEAPEFQPMDIQPTTDQVQAIQAPPLELPQ